MGETQLDVAVEQLKLIFQDTTEALQDGGGFEATDFEDWEDLYDGLLAGVTVLKDVAGDFKDLTEQEKKQAIADALNELIDIPWVPEGLEGKVFALAVGLAWKAYEDKFEKE